MNRRILLCWIAGRALARAAAFSVSFDRAAGLASSCRVALPAGLNSQSWDDWVRRHDREVRDRLRLGEEDSLANFVLFGVSFTERPRVSTEQPDEPLIDARIRDFLIALDSKKPNSRIEVLRGLVTGRDARSVRAMIDRYLAEQRQYRTVLDRSAADDGIASRLYENRGLSIDTNFRPDFVIEKALEGLKRNGALAAVTRVGIIGPGLDFTDKDRGYDYYPLQTLQPFALIDSLLRLRLAHLDDLRVSVFDISPLILSHLKGAANRPYTLELVLDRQRPWTQETLAYWRRLGDQIGTLVTPMKPPPNAGDVDRRAVRIRPDVVNTLDPEDLNIVLQSAHNGSYDLIVATNVFVYYDAFEQSLAFANVEAMLRPGGVLLSNTEMPECRGEALHQTGSETVTYSRQPSDNDSVYVYLKSSLRRGLAPQ